MTYWQVVAWLFILFLLLLYAAYRTRNQGWSYILAGISVVLCVAGSVMVLIPFIGWLLS